MKARKPRPLPSRLVRVRDQFEKWRRTRRNRGRIPEALWSSAVHVASEYGVCRTATALRLNVESLKKRMGSSRTPEATAAPAAPFVEVFPRAFSPAAELVLELENAQGSKMRIVLKGNGVPDVNTLADRFWHITS